jgi:hypothetical protein
LEKETMDFTKQPISVKRTVERFCSESVLLSAHQATLQGAEIEVFFKEGRALLNIHSLECLNRDSGASDPPTYSISGAFRGHYCQTAENAGGTFHGRVTFDDGLRKEITLCYEDLSRPDPFRELLDGVDEARLATTAYDPISEGLGQA